MTPISRARFLVPFVALFLLGQGCGGSTPPAGLDGGVYRTKDAGVTWKQLKVLNLGTKLGSIADVGTVTMAVDPQDSMAVYVGTVQNGLLYSLDGGESWQQAKGLTTGKVNAIAVDPKDKCMVYAAKANAIIKTSNCSRDWNQVYFDSRTDIAFTALAIDWYTSNILYAGTSDGDIFRSDDSGQSWRRLDRVDAIRISAIAIDPRDSRTLYASTEGAGILKSTDGGATPFTRITKPFADYDSARRAHAVIVDPNLAGTLYTISKYGIIQSLDAGATWAPMKLPTPSGAVDIKALAISPKDSKQLVYATDASIVFSVDGGKTWTPKKLPTARGVSSMLFDRAAEPSLFLGVSPPKAK